MLRFYWPRLSTLPTAGYIYVLSAHAHNLAQYASKGCQLSTGAAALISMQIVLDVDADATRARGMCFTSSSY
jgi:hypothetical protein